MAILGPTIDIHTGGIDLIFPHHTNEIAQSESATGKQFVNYWIHGGFMNIETNLSSHDANSDQTSEMKGETKVKMAKSLGNVVKLEDLNRESISPWAFRYWLMTAHYRSPINLSYEAVRAAQNALIRLMTTISGYSVGGTLILAYKERFMEFINDDLDLPQALALVWDLIKDKKQKSEDKKATILDLTKSLGSNLIHYRRLKKWIFQKK